MGPHLLESLFNPKSIAVIGASENPASVGGRAYKNLVEDGFEGDVIPVNPKYKSVLNRDCFPDVNAIERNIDLAVIATPARVVNQVMDDCGRKGIPAAVILSAGFGEMGGEGERLEERLRDTARHNDIRFIGPNSLGILRPGSGFNATFLDGTAPKGRLALVSQSGALCTAIADWAKSNNLGFSTLLSLGNATDVDFGDALDYLVGDPETRAILLYIEGIKDSRAFMSGLRVAARSKPVVVLKAGRHERGSKAATTHTGALVGSDDAFDAALERAGAVRAMTFGQLFAAAEILSTGKRVNGNRLAIVTNGGGAGVLATDRAEDLRVAIPDLDAKTVSVLDNVLPAHWSRNNPVDILGDATPERYREAVGAVLDDPNVDGVLVMLTPQAMTKPVEAAEAVIAAAEDHPKVPVIACWMGEDRVGKARQVLTRAGIPEFSTPERAVEAYSYLARYHLSQRLLLQTPAPLSDTKMPDVEGARMIIDAALSEGRHMLSDVESKAILNAFHIPANRTREARTANEALIDAESVGFPVVMKIRSKQITHKTDVGGVKTNIMAASDIRPSFDDMINMVRELRPDAVIDGVTIEPMASLGDARELMVGVKRDPVFGPVISFGAGGTMAEILQDNAVALPPLNRVLAARLIDRTRVARLLGPYRRMPAVDRSLIEDILLRVSDMVCELPHIEELDINPLFANDSRALAVDARIHVRRPPMSPEPYGHMAVHPYPSHLRKDIYLADGTQLTIRPIRPEDAEGEQEFVRNLSSEAKYFRFMHRIDELSPEMLVRFTQIDYSREMALIAIAALPAGKKQVGVARYVINPDRRTCEFALVVSDALRQQGIGSKLMQALMEAARWHGIETIEGEILAENHRMLGLMKDLGFSLRHAPDDHSVMIAERWL